MKTTSSQLCTFYACVLLLILLLNVNEHVRVVNPVAKEKSLYVATVASKLLTRFVKLALLHTVAETNARLSTSILYSFSRLSYIACGNNENYIGDNSGQIRPN